MLSWDSCVRCDKIALGGAFVQVPEIPGVMKVEGSHAVAERIAYSRDSKSFGSANCVKGKI